MIKKTRGWLALAVLLPLATLADEPPRLLEPYRSPGVSRQQLERALEDDLGSGVSGGVPVALIEALVDLQPDQLGATVADAYRRQGFLFLAGRPELPVGIMEQRQLGLRVHQFNCLACHSGTDPLDPERWVVGATNNGIDFGNWYGKVFGGLGRLVHDESREGDMALPLAGRVLAKLLPAARRQRGERLHPVEVGTLGFMVQGFAQQLLSGEERSGGARVYGAGRTVVQAAYRTMRFGLDPGPWAPVKAPDLFGVSLRETLLWTGNETYPADTSAAERVARNGMLVPWIQMHPVTRKPVPDWLTALRYPRYLRMARLLVASAPPPAPAPTDADWPRVEEGKRVFRANCASCHGDYRLEPAQTATGSPGVRAVATEYPEEILPVEEVGTDPAFASISDQPFLDAFEQSLLGRMGLFKGRVTKGYVARPLLGLRLRAPYLHNASVPNLRALLTPPAQRPARFLVGHEAAYDADAVGLRHDPAELARVEREDLRPSLLMIRETTRAGDGNQGHEFGTELPEQQKQALLAFLRHL